MSHVQMARRRVSALGVGGIAALGLGPQTLIRERKVMAQDIPETVVYVSNAVEEGMVGIVIVKTDYRARATTVRLSTVHLRTEKVSSLEQEYRASQKRLARKDRQISGTEGSNLVSSSGIAH